MFNLSSLSLLDYLLIQVINFIQWTAQETLKLQKTQPLNQRIIRMLPRSTVLSYQIHTL